MQIIKVYFIHIILGFRHLVHTLLIKITSRKGSLRKLSSLLCIAFFFLNNECYFDSSAVQLFKEMSIVFKETMQLTLL